MTLSAAKAAAAAAVKAASKAAEKAAAVKQPAGQGGLTKAMPVSATLKRFVGSAEISRTETMRKVWAYIKDKNLQAFVGIGPFSSQANFKLQEGGFLAL